MITPLTKLHKVQTLDPTILPAATALKMVTADGAKAIGFGEKDAVLETGSPADIIIVNLDQPHFTPFYNHDLLVYAGRGADVKDVIINGRIVMTDRKLTLIDLEETKAKVRELAKDVKQFAC